MTEYIKKHLFAWILLLLGVALLATSLMHLPSGDPSPSAPADSATEPGAPTQSTPPSTVAPHDHNWSEATCTVPKTCRICGITEGGVLLHRYDRTVTLPDCVNEGYASYACQLCGDHYITDKMAPLGHSWGEGVVQIPATEESEGLMGFACTVCDGETTQAIPKLEHIHSYSSQITEPTCTAEGFTTYSCRCGDSYITDKIPALTHSWDEGIVQTPATEEAEGLMRFTCSRCDAEKT